VSAPDLLVVGAGLIGTSIGLAARRAGYAVALTDQDRSRSRVAEAMGAGQAVDDLGGDPALVVVAVPPAAVGTTALRALEAVPQAVVTHVGSVQAAPAREIETRAGSRGSRFVGSHPIAGREVSGPAAASADLFADRPWAICPTSSSSSQAVEAVTALARACGASPVQLAPEEHDRLLARLSHAPQIVASALAATLAAMTSEQAGLAGPGLRDTTRLADSDPQMWGEIAGANAAALAEAVRAVAAPLVELADRLAGADAAQAQAAVQELVERGRSGRALLPGKHGRAAVPLAVVRCVVPDSPGALARLFADTAAEGVNVEDLRVEHAPGQEVGFAELAVAPAARPGLVEGLRRRGWVVTEGADEAL
jgi:prephenate dehydrogenase